MNKAENKVGYTVDVNDVTLDEVMLLEKTVAKLDEVNTNALLALMRALAKGEDNETALAAGNAVLIAAGRKPMPPMY